MEKDNINNNERLIKISKKAVSKKHSPSSYNFARPDLKKKYQKDISDSYKEYAIEKRNRRAFLQSY